MRRLLFLLLIGIALALGYGWVTQATAPLKLGRPIACPPNQNCFVLLYPDRDPGPGAQDFGCGRMTYDGHKGTDFAIPDERVMAQGVKVTAVAAGKVLRVRDGVPDRRIQGNRPPREIQGTECGNGVVLDHGRDWQTQYCHLRQGSVLVQPGDPVTEGQAIGLVGVSGQASFPHVHLVVRHQGQVVDPFVGPGAKAGCRAPKRPLWKSVLAYQPTGLIRAGFAPQLPKLDPLWSGAFADPTLPVTSPAVVFWVQTYGVLEGDQEQLRLFDPNDQVVAEFKRSLPKSQRVWVSSIGKRGTRTPLIPGRWSGTYQLSRDGAVLVELEQEVRLK